MAEFKTPELRTVVIMQDVANDNVQVRIMPENVQDGIDTMCEGIALVICGGRRAGDTREQTEAKLRQIKEKIWYLVIERYNDSIHVHHESEPPHAG